MTVAAFSSSFLFAQAPVRDDDIQGQATFKSDLAAGDKMVVPAGVYTDKGMMALIENNPRFTILTKMLKQTGLDKTIEKGKEMTLFAPTDDAFNTMSKEELAAMMAEKNHENLTSLLAFHVSPSVLKSDMMTDPVALKTAAQQDLQITTRVDDGDVVIVVGGLAKVVQPDVMVSNGVIHVIDRVLFPARNADES